MSCMAGGLIVFMLFGLGGVHAVLFVFLERRLKFLVLPPFMNRRPALPFGPRERDVPFRRGDAGRRRQEPLEILSFARRTGRGLRSWADERLEFVCAGAATVIVQRHLLQVYQIGLYTETVAMYLSGLPY
jgi:hypothetical protein